jgi:Membrane-bound lytic murein transglycosylase C, N-terminal domain
MKEIILTGIACLLLPGCQSFDKTLDSADRAVSITKAPTARTITDIAKADNREAAIREGLKRRAIVDFDAGMITVETVDDKDPKGSLKNAIVTTLLTPDDPRAVDLFSDKSVTLSSAKEPYLLGLVQDQGGKSIATPAQAEGFADYLLEKQATTRKVDVQEGAKDALFVTVAMVANFSRDKVAAVNSINGIEPPAVYEKLRTGLPYEETRQYLVRVVGYRKQFLSFGK